MDGHIATWTAENIPEAIAIVLDFEDEMAPLRAAMRSAKTREEMTLQLRAMTDVLTRYSTKARALELMQEVHDNLFASLTL
jgi:hypothetical protein